MEKKKIITDAVEIMRHRYGKRNAADTAVAPLRRVRERLTWTHGDTMHCLWLGNNSSAVGVVFRGDGGWFWKTWDGRSTHLSGEKPTRLGRALEECKAFAKRLIVSGDLK